MSENEEIKETTTVNLEECKIPEPVVTGNAQLEIIGHKLLFKEGGDKSGGMGIAIEMKNIAGADIGKAVFNAVFYDAKGDVLDTIEAAMPDFRKDKTRSFRIESAKAADADIKSYAVNVLKVILTPAPVATGNDRVTVLKHGFQEAEAGAREEGKRSIDMAIRNVSDKTIATAVFEAVFYDGEGNVLEKLRHKEFELMPSTSRAILITPDKIIGDAFKSYKVTLLKTITTDFEKVQLRRHEIRSIEAGEEVRGTVKNISDVKTDTALVATFKDAKDEKIGTKVIQIKDIEPGAIKQFHFVFNVPKGDAVRSYTISIGEIVEETVPATTPPAITNPNSGQCCGH